MEVLVVLLAGAVIVLAVMLWDTRRNLIDSQKSQIKINKNTIQMAKNFEAHIETYLMHMRHYHGYHHPDLYSRVDKND